jgi:penicillin-binding protein 2
MKLGEHRELLVRRFERLLLGGFVAFALVFCYYGYLQLVRGEEFRRLADSNRLREISIEAPRGTILDRRGRVLVEDEPSFRLLLDPTRAKEVARSLELAARLLGRSPEVLKRNLERFSGIEGYRPVPLAESISLGEAARFQALQLEHPEFLVEIGQRRVYRLGQAAAHLLGHLGEVRKEELARPGSPYRLGDLLGRRGIERAYEAVLRGEDGERIVVVDSLGRAVAELGRRVGRPGGSISLTLDAELQLEAERLLAEQAGAVVALDPRDGAIRALASQPSFDPNQFALGLTAQAWQSLLENPLLPMQNRALQASYPPGSVFKVFMAVAGLAEGKIAPSDRVFCPGYANFYGRRFHCWKKGGHGTVDLEQALQVSCDVYFYFLGQKLGIERIATWAQRFGFGQPTGIELEGERTGLVPNDAWSRRVRGHPWSPGETISVAIGQGALLTTPLQIAIGIAAIANGGYRVRPHLVELPHPPPPVPLGVPPSALVPVQRGMERVMEPGGTAAAARPAGVHVAGKTGTVQVISHEAFQDSTHLPWHLRNHAWFASYAPAESPELVVVVFVEHGGQGSRAAAPIAKALYEFYFESKQLGSAPPT